jgi:DNA helicase-2/ATP-dependent DNA helicase PcrA
MSDYTWPKITADNTEKIERIKKISAEVDRLTVKEDDVSGVNTNTVVDYKAELNSRQYLAAVTVEGPVLIIAGAGSGKTRTATYRVAYMVESGINPEEILMLTFTRKAAGEMSERLDHLLSGNSGKVTTSTFHSFAIRILKEFPQYSGITQRFIILDSQDSLELVDYVLSHMDLKKNLLKVLKKDVVYDVISKARNWSTTVSKFIDSNLPDLKDYKEYIEEAAKLYKKEKSKNGNLDYDDILIIMKNLLKKNEDFRKVMNDRYKYIMVDEYQDTNVLQKEIVDYLAGDLKNIMVVGDDAQAIYRFRGATMENILTFQETYPDCKVIKLEHNYRSVQPILEFTNPIIDNCIIGYKKTLFSTRDGDKKPVVKRFDSKFAEAEFIVKQIKEFERSGMSYSDIAVIYRSGYHGKVIQTELERNRIPYVVYGGLKFSERKHVKDMICLLRLVVNSTDKGSWNRLLRRFDGVGEITAAGIINNIVDEKEGEIDFSEYKASSFYEDVSRLADTILSIRRSEVPTKDKVFVAKDFCKNNFIDPDEQYRVDDLDLLNEIAKNYRTLDTFLNDFAIEPPNKSKGKKAVEDEDEDPCVVLTTVHSSKGLEWDAVFVPHCLDGLFPSYRSFGNIEDLEEERRLFYVACTRARDHLHVTMQDSQRIGKDMAYMPSRFLAEVNPRSYEGSV